MTANESGFSRDPVEQLAEEFVGRVRAGQRPRIEEYQARVPGRSAEIAELFAMLLALEDLGDVPSGTETAAGAGGKASDELEIPERLGEYRLLREIGRGGMGVVYEAVQETLGRHVALKVLSRRAFADASQIARFRLEARAAARLHHSNIVPVFGVGEDRGVHYYAMQHIRGHTLTAVLEEVRRLRADRREGSADRGARALARSTASTREVAETLVTTRGTIADGRPSGRAGTEPASSGSSPSPSSWSEYADSTPYHRSVARIGEQVANALAYAHGEGILHRDIKPSNLLLDARGCVWVTDFGLAKEEASGDLTASGAIVGTLRYMAPERLAGREDARADVYGLGVTLYEMLALVPAFDESDRGRLLSDIVTRRPRSLSRIDARIPRDLETVIDKAMARDERQRYASAGELAEDLRRFLRNEPVAARRITPLGRFVRWCQRNPTIAAMAAAIAVLAVTLAVSASVWAIKLQRQSDAVTRRLAESKLEAGRAWRTSGRPGQRVRALAALFEAAGTGVLDVTELRNEVVGALMLSDLELIGSSFEVGSGIKCSPGLEYAVAYEIDGRARIHDFASQAPIPSSLEDADGTPWPLHPGTFSESGRYFWLRRSSDELVVLELPAATVAARWPARRAIASFLPDETSMLVVEETGRTTVRGLDGVVRREWSGETRRASRLHVSPGGARFATVGVAPGNHVARVFEIETGAEVARLVHPCDILQVAFSPDLNLLAVGCVDRAVRIWDLRQGRRLETLTGHSAEVHALAFSPDGRTLVSADWNHRLRVWELSSMQTLVETAGSFLAFLDEGHAIGFADGSAVGRWALRRSTEFETRRVPVVGYQEKLPHQLEISPDGRWIAIACGSAGTLVWSLHGDVEARFEGHSQAVRWAGDGSALLVATPLGLHSWPLREESSRAWTLGPPTRLAGVRGTRFDVAGGRVGAYEGSRVRTWSLEPEPALVDTYRHEEVHEVTVSPSGRFIVSSPWRGREVVVRDVASRETLVTFPANVAHAKFSPDERWLGVTTDRELRLYRTDSWTLARRLDRERAGSLASRLKFTADSRRVFFGRSGTKVDLIDIESGELLVSFESPRADRLGAIDVDPTGSRLVVASPSLRAVLFWHLDGIRSRLREWGLDWNPPLDEPRERPEPPSSLRVDRGDLRLSERVEKSLALDRTLGVFDARVKLVEVEPSVENLLQRARSHESFGVLREALVDVSLALELEPSSVGLLVDRARLAERLGERAVAIADLERAVELLGSPDGEPESGGGPSAGSDSHGISQAPGRPRASRERERLRARLEALRGR